MFGLVAGLVGGLVKKGVTSLIKSVAKKAAPAAAGAAVAVGTTIATGTIVRMLPSGAAGTAPTTAPPQLPSGFNGGYSQPPVPAGIIPRTIQKILPGGKTGYEYTPVNDMRDRYGRPIAVYPAEQTRTIGPSGYVVVNYNGERVAMLRHFAQRLGLYSAPPKPPVSGWDVRAINRAHAAQKRVKKLAGKVGYKCGPKGKRCA